MVARGPNRKDQSAKKGEWGKSNTSYIIEQEA
jgi:hypothetical protein